MVSAQSRLIQARYAISRGVSQRRACALMEVSRSGLYYQLRMPVKDAPVIQAMLVCQGSILALALAVSGYSLGERGWR